MDTISTQIREYISQNLLFTDDGFDLSDDASFLEEGVIDSVGVMDLVMFVEERFGINVPDQDITPDNFDSVAKLSNYIRARANGMG